MKRHNEHFLLQWYQKNKRKPFVIRGARQVGKSTLVRIFCQNNQLDLLEINLEKIKLKSFLKQQVHITDVLDEIQLLSKKKISPNTIIFFDEIQEQPELLKFLRFFYEERPELAVIAAGSLLEIALRDENFSFPVGRIEFMHLGPMLFSEFLLATNNEFLLNKIKTQDFTETVINLANEQFRNYLYVGGMPQVVKTFVEEKSLVSVRDVQEQIIQTYMADFPKYNSRIQYDRIQRIFYAAVTCVGKKMVYQKLDSQSQSRDIRRVIELLYDARVLQSCVHSDGNMVPLMGESDLSIQKLFFLDVGLVNCMMRLDLETIDSELKNQFSTKGMMAEQFVAQHLAYKQDPSIEPKLFYWLRDKGSQKGEVDFLIEQGSEVIPIEVKASSSGHLKSLFYFAKEKNKKTAIKLSMDQPSTEKVSHLIADKKIEIELRSMPLWFVEFI